MNLPPQSAKSLPPPLPPFHAQPGPPPRLPFRRSWGTLSAGVAVAMVLLVSMAVFRPQAPTIAAKQATAAEAFTAHVSESAPKRPRKSKPETPQEASAALIDEIDRKVARLIADFATEVHRANAVTNPLRSRNVDIDAFRNAMGQALDPLLDERLVLRTQVGAFHQSGGEVTVALVGDLAQFYQDRPTQVRALRFRLNPERCVEWTLRPVIQRELEQKPFMERLVLEPFTPFITTVGNRISTASITTAIRTERDAAVFRQLEIGSFYDCHIRVTKWQLIWGWENEEEKNLAISWEMFGGAGDAHFLAYQRPYVKVTCEWVRD